MFQLIKFECYKIIHRKIVVAAIIFLLIDCIYVYDAWVDPLGRHLYLLSEDGAIVTGESAITLDKKITNFYAGTFTNETAERIFQEQKSDYVRYHIRDDRVRSNYAYEMVVHYFIRTNNQLDQSYQFQSVLLQSEDIFPSEAFPLYIGYSKPWSTTMHSIAVGLITLTVCIIFILSSTFAEENEWKMNPLLFTSKVGKSQCYVAKVLAAYLIGVLLSLLVIGLNLLATFIFFGINGLSSSIQLASPYLYDQIKYQETVGGALLKVIVLFMTDVLFMISITIAASVILHRSISAVIGAVLVYLFPALFKITGLTEVISLPAQVNHTEFSNILQMPDCNLGAISIHYCYFVVTILLTLALLAIWLTWRYYRRYDE